MLAKVQWLFSKGGYKQATNVMAKYFEGGDYKTKIPTVLDPYLDLLGNGFSISQMYKIKNKITISR